jgi:hypothetical protein
LTNSASDQVSNKKYRGIGQVIPTRELAARTAAATDFDGVSFDRERPALLDPGEQCREDMAREEVEIVGRPTQIRGMTETKSQPNFERYGWHGFNPAILEIARPSLVGSSGPVSNALSVIDRGASRISLATPVPPKLRQYWRRWSDRRESDPAEGTADEHPDVAVPAQRSRSAVIVWRPLLEWRGHTSAASTTLRCRAT